MVKGLVPYKPTSSVFEDSPHFFGPLKHLTHNLLPFSQTAELLKDLNGRLFELQERIDLCHKLLVDLRALRDVMAVCLGRAGLLESFPLFFCTCRNGFAFVFQAKNDGNAA